MAKVKITALTEELLGNFLAEHGLELYRIEYVKEGREWFLRVYIDKVPDSDEEEAYVSIEDCELVSRFLSEKLDEADPIEQNYYLEVSSPGLERELLQEKDYQRFIGKTVSISLYTAYEGKKKYEGRLAGFVNHTVLLELPAKTAGEPDTKLEIPLDRIAKTKLTVDFS